MSEMVERVARAICQNDRAGPACVMDEHPERPSCSKSNCERFAQARAAIAAMREPTSAMFDVGAATASESQGGLVPGFVWRFMIDEALR